MIATNIGWVAVVLGFLTWIPLTWKSTAVRGSYQAYAWATAYKISVIGVVVLWVVAAIIRFVVPGEEWGYGFLDLFVAAIWLTNLWFTRKDDDWFSGRGKKIWGGIKRRAAKIKAAATVKPVAAPVPSFG